MLAPLDLSAKILFPVTVSGYLRSTGTLQQNQKNIAEAVTVEFRHGTEICGIPLTVEQFRDTRFHLVGDFLHLFHSFLIAYLSPPPVEMCLILRRKNALTGVSVPGRAFSDGGKIFLYHDGRAVNRGPLLWLWQSYLLWRPVYC